MKSHKLLVFLTIIGLIVISQIPYGFTNGANDTLGSEWASITPTIDGDFEETEWSDAYHTSFYHEYPSTGHNPDYIHIYVKNNENKLFLLIDSLPDTDNDTMDTLFIDFDCNYDNIRDNNVSMALDRSGTPSIRNVLADWNMGFFSTPNKEENHTFIEIAINITMDSIYDGNSFPSEINYNLPVGTNNNSIRIFLDVTPRICNWTYPYGIDLPAQPSEYAVLTFASPPSGIPFANPYLIILILLGTSATIIYYRSIKEKEI